MKPIIVIVGPTASGKTDLSIRIAKSLNGECINADSTQIFKGTDIATNKITLEEMDNIKHYLLSIKEVNETYSVAEFQKDARNFIDKIHKMNKIPIIVGGTGLYINALLMNYKFSGDDHIKDFSKKFDELDNIELWNILNNIDKIEANKIHPNNRYRVIRALEIIELNKNSKSNIIKNNKTFYYKNIIMIGLEPKREELYVRINNRVLDLVNRGLIQEIELAYKMCEYNESSQSLKCIGGPEIISYLKGKITYESAIEEMQKNNRHYARRQLTWFKNQFDCIKWYEFSYINFEETCNSILTYLKKVKRVD
ncbi:tRNA delta(2)-isopentenylpyrophosphate transferase [Spiroplasma corruscae]|uniref:tRNA dimethylallyltransferase n=1 Tax=Spiroplasma corruscae TaxID=216934 RepID=A0A222ENN3_9MOLU|nr:tRNA (adenosine(37)-N6)-dimethylallyltransferase MiaA [Spiroplasma corruscae]ASP28110.1 tRNA delta(2)-isopentenylpyrophosphate transferase [Spiroplasma corruscae]